MIEGRNQRLVGEWTIYRDSYNTNNLIPRPLVASSINTLEKGNWAEQVLLHIYQGRVVHFLHLLIESSLSRFSPHGIFLMRNMNHIGFRGSNKHKPCLEQVPRVGCTIELKASVSLCMVESLKTKCMRTNQRHSGELYIIFIIIFKIGIWSRTIKPRQSQSLGKKIWLISL